MVADQVRQPPPVDAGVVTQALILSRFGPRLTLDEVARLMRISEQSLRNMMQRGESPLPYYRRGKRTFFDYRDVAQYFDACREVAHEHKIDEDIDNARLRRRPRKDKGTPKKKGGTQPPEIECEGS